MGYCKFYKEKEQVSYNSGQTWSDVPDTYRKGRLYEYNSPDCNPFSTDGKWTAMYVDATTTISKSVPCDSTSAITQSEVGVDNFKYINYFIIGDCVKTVEDNALLGKNTITSLKVGKNVEYIGHKAFKNCSGIPNAILPNSVERICGEAFNGCSSLESIDVPYKVKNIYRYVFANCSSLTSVTIPNSATSIYEYAFANCTSLSSVTIPNSVKIIGQSAFQNCSNLKSITIPNGVTRIGKNAFSGCTSLTSVTIPNSVTEIDESAFATCSGLTSVTIPGSVKSIGQGAFFGCSGLTSVVLEEGVERIGYSCFMWCYNLQNVTLPSSVTIFERQAFEGTPWWNQYQTDQSHIYDNFLYVNNTVYRLADSSRNTNGTFRPGTISIDGPRYYSGITSVTIPEGVTTLGDLSFEECGKLTSVSIPNSIRHIGYQSFYSSPWWSYYSRDTNNHFGNIIYINDVAHLAVNKKITCCGFRDGTVSISPYAFAGCFNLTEVVIPDTVTEIWEYAFYDCGITSIVIPDSVTVIGDYAFALCKNLKYVKIGSGVTSIGVNAFAGCDNLKSITIPDNVKSDDDTFIGWDYSGLTSLHFGTGIEEFEGYYDGLPLTAAKVTFKTIKPPTMPNALFRGQIYAPSGSINDYRDDWTNSVMASAPVTGISLDKETLSINCFDSGEITATVYPVDATDKGVIWLSNDTSVVNVNDGIVTAANVGSATITAITYDGGYSAKCTVSVSMPTTEIRYVGNKLNIDLSKFTPAATAETFDDTTKIGKIEFAEPVTAIGSTAFWRVNQMSKIVLPDSVRSIEASAFQDCSNLRNITFGKGVTTIGDSAFSGCRYLQSITLPESIVSISSYAFNGCYNLKGVTIGSGVTEIWKYAFYNCSGLTSITCLATTPPGLGSYALSGSSCPIYVPCESLDAYRNSSNWTSVWSRLQCSTSAIYYNARKKLNVNLSKMSPYAGIETFESGIGIISYISPVTSIGEGTFSGMTDLYRIKIPDEVTTIGNSAFYQCTNLTGITIGESVTSIGNSAFYQCSGLTSFTIHDGFTSIGANAFNGCSGLTVITVDSTTPPTLGSGAFDNTNNCPIYVPAASLNAYKTASGWSAYASRITCFNPIIYNASSELNVSLASFTPAATAHTFVDGVGFFEFDADVVSISQNAFSGRTSLTSIDIPDSVTSIGNSAFESCSGLTSVTIPSSVTSIGWDAFSYCRSLTSIDIPDSVTSIGNRAFESCSGLTSCTIGSGATEIGEGVFNECSNLTSVTIRNGATTIGNRAFQGCTSLTSIDIPDSVTTIRDRAFGDCISLVSVGPKGSGASVEIPSGVTSIIGSQFGGTFSDCINLTTVVLPDSVTSIGGWAFKNCSGLTSITVNRTTPPTLGIYAFNNTNNCPIYVPAESVEAYKSASGWSAYSSRIQAIP